MSEPVTPVRVRSIHWEAPEICSFLLCALDDSSLSPFEPGSHIDVKLPNGLMRSYSLSNDGSSRDYRITVARDVNSTGGSAFMIEQLRAGATIAIGAARSNFPVFEDAPFSVFIAGGIGVTPFVSMAARLSALGRRWRLHYCVRTRDRAALLSDIETLAQSGYGEVVMNFDHEPDGIALDLDGVIGALADTDHVYCCGPIGMLDAFRDVCRARNLPDDRVHFEYFKSNVQAATTGGFDVILAQSGKTIRVEDGKTILDVLLLAGLDVPFSCQEGVCGACETKVLAGQPDHRDLILSIDERASNRTMMICCSGSKSESLTLDI